MSNERPFPAFYVSERSFWGRNPTPEYLPEINVSLRYKSGGSGGELSICWIKLDNKLTPKLEIFDDAWKLFTAMPKLWPALAKLDSQDPTPEQIVHLLLGLGFKDMTDRKRVKTV